MLDLVKIDTKIRFSNKGLSKKSIQNYKYALRHYLTWMGGKPENPANLKSFFTDIKQSVKPRHFNLIRQAVRSYLTEKYKKHFEAITHINQLFKDIKAIKINKAIKPNKFWSKDKIYDLASCVSPRLSVLIQFAFQSSLRISEMLSLKQSNLDIQGDVCYITCYSKQNQEYKTFVSTLLIEKIKSIYNGDSDYLFHSKSGKPLSRHNCHNELVRQCVKQGFDKISFHAIARHSKAMFLANERHLPIQEISQALNHSDISTTMAFYMKNTYSPSKSGLYDLPVV